MGTSLTETLEPDEAALRSETTAAPIKPVDKIAVLKPVIDKKTTQEWGGDAEILEGADTHGHVIKWIELLPQSSVSKFHSATQRAIGQKEPEAGLIGESSLILQEWEGVVLERAEESFTARLYEGFRDFPVKRAEISLEDVADEQRKSVVPGARFSWMIGYSIRAGTRRRFSEIYFRRLPPWTKEELETAAQAVAKLREDAGWV